MNNFCIVLVMLDLFVGEIFPYSETFARSISSLRLAHYVICIILSILIITKISLRNITLFKSAVLIMFVARLVVDLLDIYIYHDLDNDREVIQMLI